MAQTDVSNIAIQLSVNIAQISSKMKKLETDVKKTNAALSKTKSVINGTSKETKTLGDKTEQTAKKGETLKKAFSFAAIALSLRKLIRVFTRGLSEMSSYIENYNLYLVSMGDYQSKALKFQNDLNTSWGTNISQTMRYQGFFMNLTSSLGIAKDFAYEMSKSLTLMTYDMASLFNWTSDVAYQRLQAGIVGQTKPLRYAGVDVTQQTIQPYLDDLGINKSVIELTQAEKVMLRYIAVLHQTKNAQGDYARTMESTANQMKIMTEMSSETYRWFGALFVGVITKALPYWNAFLMVLKEVFKFFATMLGVSATDFDFFTGNVSTGLDDIEESVVGIDDSVKKLKAGLRGFDEINNITTPSASGGDVGIGIGSSTLILQEELTKMMTDYEESMKQVKYSAYAIRDRWLEILGFTQSTDEATGEMTLKFERITPALALISGVLALITGKLVLLASKPLIWLLGGKGGTAAVTGVSGFAGGITKSIGGMFTSLLGFFGNLTGNITIAQGLVGGVILLIIGSVVALYMAFKENLLGIQDIWLEVWEGIKEVFNTVITILTPLFVFLGDLISDLWESSLSPLWESFKLMFASIAKVVGEILRDVFIPLLNFFVAVLLPPIVVIIGAVAVLVTEFVGMVSKFLTTFFDAISNIIGHISNFIGVVVEKLSPLQDVMSGIITFITDIFTGNWEKAWETVVDLFSGIWSGVKDTFSTVWDWIMKKFNGGGTIFKGIVEGISGVFKSLVNGLIDGINAIIRTPFNVINGLMNKVRSFSIFGAEPFKKLWGYNPLSIPKIPKLALGGQVNEGQMFIAREAGAELVGEVGGKTTVMNNDQIVRSVSQGVAKAVSGSMGGGNQPTTIILKMNELELGRATVKSINKAQQTLGLTLQGV